MEFSRIVHHAAAQERLYDNDPENGKLSCYSNYTHNSLLSPEGTVVISNDKIAGLCLDFGMNFLFRVQLEYQLRQQHPSTVANLCNQTSRPVT